MLSLSGNRFSSGTDCNISSQLAGGHVIVLWEEFVQIVEEPVISFICIAAKHHSLAVFKIALRFFKFRLIASLMTKTDALVVCKQSKVALRLARLCGQLTVLANRGQLQSAIRRNASRYWIETKMTFS